MNKQPFGMTRLDPSALEDKTPQSVFEHLHRRLEARAGLLIPPSPTRYSYDDLARTEWSSTFEGYMRRRLIMGALRYGRLHAPGKKKYSRVASMKRRLNAYLLLGNLEYLVDVANLCLLEFEECDHPLKHFHSTDGVGRIGVSPLQ
jgi:hypothetical protein